MIAAPSSPCFVVATPGASPLLCAPSCAPLYYRLLITAELPNEATANQAAAAALAAARAGVFTAA